jgi:hypothetical protein
MKRKLFSLALILELSVSIMVGMQTINPIGAQFQPGPPPPSLSVTSPTVTIQSPSHLATYNSSDVLLDFTIAKPQIWLDDFSETYGAAVAFMYWGQLDFVAYNLDGRDSGNVSVNDVPLYTVYESRPPDSFNFSIMLYNLSNGKHSLFVSVYGKVYNTPNALPITGKSIMVNFSTIQTPTLSPTPSPELTPEPEPFPTTLIIAASAASATVIAVSLMIYFKKHKR